MASDEEKQLVESFLHAEEVQRELEEIEQALMHMAERAGREAPASVKTALFNELWPETGHSSGRQFRLHTSEPMRKHARTWRQWAVAASVLGILSIATNVYLFIRSEQKERQLAAYSESYQDLNHRIESLRVQNSDLRNMSQFFANGEVHTYQLVDHYNRKDPMGMVYWDVNTGEVLIQGGKLPVAPVNRQYQVWAMIGNKTIDLGLLPMDHHREQMLARLKNIRNLNAFCITLEPLGGREKPTLESVVAIAEV